MTDFEIDRFVRLEGTDYDRRRKLMNKDISKIRKLYLRGVSIAKLAKMYNVTYPTIKYHVNTVYKEDVKRQRVLNGFQPFDTTAARIDRIQYKRSILSKSI